MNKNQIIVLYFFLFVAFFAFIEIKSSLIN